MIDKIIVPVDFSEYSKNALQSAATLAKVYNAEVLVLHMLELPSSLINTVDFLGGPETLYFLKLAEKRFEEFLDEPYLESLTVTPIVKHFKVFSEISEVAENEGANLIVMGSHGASGISEFLIGSNTEKVVRHSKVPVLIVKDKPVTNKFDTAVFVSDFSQEGITAYRKIEDMFYNVSNLISLYVNLPNDLFMSSNEIEEKASLFFEKADGTSKARSNFHTINDYSIEKGVFNFSEKQKVDLIVIPTHGRKGIAHFFEGSVSEDIANHANIPVLTLKL